MQIVEVYFPPGERVAFENAARKTRRQDLAAALMRAAEFTAHECGKTLLVLDTVTGADAERLYDHLGWRRVGVIPGYALMPFGGLCSTTVFYRSAGV